MKKFVLISLVLFAQFNGFTQWSSNPLVNTQAMGSYSDRTFSKIVADNEGSFYVSCWQTTDAADNFAFWLQRINSQGYRVWGDDGFRISNNPTRSWLSDYSLNCDSSGNAIIVFEDVRSADGKSHVYAYSLDKEGKNRWAPNGVSVNTDNNESYSPVAAITENGNTIVAWNASSDDTVGMKGWIEIQKISATGALLWANSVKISNADSSYLFPYLLPLQNEDFLMVWERRYSQGGGFGKQYYTYIYAQRFDSDGNQVWANPIAICDHGDSARCMPQFLRLAIARDENGGAFVSWFDDRFFTMYFNIYTQWINPDGTVNWPVNGITVSPVNRYHVRVEPGITYDRSGHNLYLFWGEARSEGGYLTHGLVGQKISAAGAILWGDTGKIFHPFSMDTGNYVISAKMATEHNVVLVNQKDFIEINPPDTSLHNNLEVLCLTPDGNYLWNPGDVTLSATPGFKFSADFTQYNGTQFVLSWDENRESPYSYVGQIYVQNITAQGKPGPLSIHENGDYSENLHVYPNPATDKVYIQPGLNNQFAKILISDIYGRIMKEESFIKKGEIWSLDCSAFKAGVYIISAESDNGIWSRSKLVVK